MKRQGLPLRPWGGEGANVTDVVELLIKKGREKAELGNVEKETDEVNK